MFNQLTLIGQLTLNLGILYVANAINLFQLFFLQVLGKEYTGSFTQPSDLFPSKPPERVQTEFDIDVSNMLQ